MFNNINDLYDQLMNSWIINEAYYSIPTDGNVSDIEDGIDSADQNVFTSKKVGKIYIRMEAEGKFAHSCSVKYQKHSRDRGDFVIIPTKPYQAEPKAVESVRELWRKYKQEINPFLAFIYDNQMAIIAYWYSSRFSEKIQRALRVYIAE